MTLSISPAPYHQFFDSNGNPLAGGLIFTYGAGTSTKLAAYTNGTGTVAHTNPIVLDSAGRPPSPIYLAASTYKFVAALADDTDPPTSPIWTVDPVPSTSVFDADLDIAAVTVVGQGLDIGDFVYLSQGDGGRTAGRWYKTDSDLYYASAGARVIGVVVTVPSDIFEFTARRAGRVTGLSGLTGGLTYYVSATSGEITATAPTANVRRVAVADSATSVVLCQEIEEPEGFVPLDLLAAREVAANVFQNAAANGGLLASDTTPAIQRVNGATDKAIRVNWAAANVDEITWNFAYPPDLDDARDVTVHLLAAMGGAVDNPVIAVSYFERTGDANAGGNTVAVTGTTIDEYTVTIAAANIGAAPTFASVSLVPAAHGTDALFLYAVWIEYSRRSAL